MKKQSRIRIERAIYKSPIKEDYYIVSYSKETKKTKTLMHFDNLQDARIWRDTNLRFAKYGKGISKLKNGNFRANIMLYAGNEIDSFYVGTYKTVELAIKARLDFIEKLK